MTEKRKAFFNQIAPESAFYLLFDYLPGITFFAKNKDYELVCANHAFLERLGFHAEADIVGKTDFELFPEALAKHFRSDDQFVITHKQPKLNIVELFINTDGLPDWYLTNKLPVFNKKNEVIGLMGTAQSYNHGKQFVQPYLQIEKAIRYIRENFRKRISADDIAKQLNISSRQLNRRFQETLKMSPRDFIMRLRIKTACQELSHSSDSILDIALTLGFYDQSTFSLQFKKHTGITPLQYRKQHRLSTEDL